MSSASVLRPAVAAAAMLGVASVAAAQPAREAGIKTVPVVAGLYMLAGQGGNIGLFVGPDGAFLVDDQFAPVTPAIQRAVAAVSKQPVRFVLNTHWHPDHTGGNETLGKAGALIVAHDNVRTRMAVRQFIEHINRDVPPSPPGALPVVTFATAVTFHWNGDTIHVMHMPHAHTDGDAIVHLAKSNVLHLGDTYFAGAYPIIDLRNGGSIDGLIAAAERALALANPQTRIIPGHGPLSNRVELAAWRDMLVSVRDAVRGLVKRGSTLAQVLASAPTARFDARYGQGFVKPEAFVRMVYRSVGGAPAAGTPPAR